MAPLRAEAQELLERQAELYWKNWITGAPIDLASTYQGHPSLFTLDHVRQAAAAEAAEADPMARRAFRFFRLYVEGEYLGAQEALVTDAIANLEATATFPLEGREVKFRELDALEASEPKHEERLAMSNASAEVFKKLNPLLTQREALNQKLAIELGHPSYLELASQMRDADIGALADLAERVLTATDPIYLPAMKAAVKRELSLDLADLRRADIPRFFHDAEVTSAFPAEQMMPRLQALLGGLGIDLASMKNIAIDDRPLDSKNPRAVCFAIKVPSDIRLSLKPRGGVDDYRQLYHETGHALHFAFTTTPVWEFQQLGNETVAEAYAFLLEDLLEDPAYLQETGMTGELLKSYVRSAAVRKLYMLRRYAAKVLYEKELHAGAADPKALYRRLLARAYGFAVTAEDAERFLEDDDGMLYSADYLRAWLLAAQLDQALHDKFAGRPGDGGAGGKWWHSRQAGDFLKGLWAQGKEPGADDIARALGASGLELKPLLDRLSHRVESSGK